MKIYELTIKVQKEGDGGYLALCPTWKDCYAQGDTVGEALQELYAVANTLIEIYLEEDLTIPLLSKEPVLRN
ncbi:MAG: type II toxin-antitoxin system HicB family antitoxin [Candidatus Vogelbacteria bacterium]|nr:type II toxin-antitoxin system HicB family antitoxin [Candidatus Vogelbacteria bacterium]